jgi:hypothetical protein
MESSHLGFGAHLLLWVFPALLALATVLHHVWDERRQGGAR